MKHKNETKVKIVNIHYVNYTIPMRISAKNRRVLVCFSVFTSWRRLAGGGGRSDSLDVLDGVRILAISWIVLGHRFAQSLQVPNLTLLDMERVSLSQHLMCMLLEKLS
jgi:hypothetical protein